MLSNSSKTKIKIVRKVKEENVDLMLSMKGSAEDILSALAECVVNYCFDNKISLAIFEKILDNANEYLKQERKNKNDK